MADPIIRALSPALVEDYLRFFDHDAFADNPKWASCYCYFYHAPREQTDWGTRAGAENRAAVRELCCDGWMHGYLAYVAGKQWGSSDFSRARYGAVHD